MYTQAGIDIFVEGRAFVEMRWRYNILVIYTKHQHEYMTSLPAVQILTSTENLW